jgi:hypothetical protein
MKKIVLILSLAVATLSYSCKEGKKEKKAEETTATMEKESAYSLVSDSTKVSFVAYKTTEKLPVGGEFKSIKITELGSGETPLEILNGSKFSIPVSSLFTNDATGTRDPKITEFFFGAMKDTELISGTFKLDGENASIDVTLNGETANIPLDVTSNMEDIYTFSGVMDLKKWNASDAVASLNKVCEALHTGPDGVSKTWDEVAIKADVLFAKN